MNDGILIFFFKTDNFLSLDAGDKINAVLNRGGRFWHALHSPGRQVGGLSHLSLFVLSRNRSIFYSLESTEVRCCNRRGRFQHALPSPGRQLGEAGG